MEKPLQKNLLSMTTKCTNSDHVQFQQRLIE